MNHLVAGDANYGHSGGDNGDRRLKALEAVVMQQQESQEALMKAMQLQEAVNLQQQEELDALKASIKCNNSGRAATTEPGEEIFLVDGEKPETAEQKQPMGDEDWYKPFGESTYTLIYLCAANSHGFWYGLFVYSIQMLTIWLTLVGILDLQSEDNVMKIPPMTDLIVTVSQGVTVFLALAYQSDLIEAVMKLQEGYFPEVLESHPGSTYPTWLLSCVAQLLAGLSLLATIFILTMQVTDVLSIMLNFAALHFMAEIDDLGFGLAKLGFVTPQVRRQAEAVDGVIFPKRRTTFILRRVLYCLTLTILFVGYGVIKSDQVRGLYLPSYVYCQFGDGYNPTIPYFSGILTAVQERSLSHREYRDLGTGTLLLAYCPSEESWTFSKNDDPCDFIAKSYTTSVYDVSSIPWWEWEVKDSMGRLEDFDYFRIINRDCDPDACQGTCGASGLCECSQNQFGMDCEFDDVCPRLLADTRFNSFPTVDMNGTKLPVSDDFQLLQNPKTSEYLHVYDMPVYYSNKSFPANVMFFGGRRWIITSEYDLINLTLALNENPGQYYFSEYTISVLEEEFHAYHQANYTPLFISDAVDFGKPSFIPSPVDLRWWTVKESDEVAPHFEPDIPIATLLSCQSNAETCIDKPSDFCGFYGDCENSTGLCSCRYGYSGDRCETQDACDENPFRCGNKGFCDESSGACQCDPPYFGNACDRAHKCYEEDGACKSGGFCNTTSGYCGCGDDPAIDGIACERRASCFYFGCSNGGICPGPGRNGECICRPPFHGAHCELVGTTQEDLLCLSDQDCADGECNSSTGICVCSDPARYGTLCEYQFSCSSSFNSIPCLNGGSCNNQTDLCDCPDPYFGPDCGQVPPCVADADCAGRGTCDTDSGTCNCVSGRFGDASPLPAGKRCERSQKCESDEDCHARGTCNPLVNICECFPGFGGYLCEEMIVGLYPDRYDGKQEKVQELIDQCGFEDPYCSTNQTLD